MKNISKEDYLKKIYHLQKNSNRAIKSVELARDLGISKASTNEMIKKLVNKGLVEHKIYGSINLTKKGIEEAERIVYKHKILENFLLKILGIKKDRIHEEADKLEQSSYDFYKQQHEQTNDEVLRNSKKISGTQKIPKEFFSELKKFFKWMMEQENAHYELIQKAYDYIKNPVGFYTEEEKWMAEGG